MKAILCKSHGLPDTLVLDEIASPKPGPKQVVISVKACGVNFPDTLIIQGKYQFKPEMPFSPGGELAGVVKEVGEGVSHLKPGDHVIAFTGWGGFAEEVVTEAFKVIPIPPGFDFKVAASFAMVYGTSYHALKDRAQLKAGETVLVLGAAGGVGTAAIQIAKAMGARVIAAASSDEKCALCTTIGADATINYSKDNLRDAIKALTDGKGPDVIYDPVGGDFAEPAFRSIAWRGRYLVVGFASGPIPALPFNLALLKGASIVGVFWGDFAKREPQANAAMMAELAQWYGQGKIKPVIDRTMPMSELKAACAHMGSRGVKGKLVMVN